MIPYELEVKLLDPKAKLPTVVHPGEDLAYDIYSLEEAYVYHGKVTVIRTGIAASAKVAELRLGLVICDRSSLAKEGLTIHGGIIDAGYRGEIRIIMSKIQYDNGAPTFLPAGSKIAQMIPTTPRTGKVVQVESLPESLRGEKAFGSSGL